jgi:hypothetical protein
MTDSTASTIKHQIKHRWNGSVLFECDLPGDTPSEMVVRLALEKATTERANLSDANLSGANLSGAELLYANLRGADISYANLLYANLSGANLSGADLSCADLRYANLIGANLLYADDDNLRATTEQSIENLDKVRAIILDDKARLEMGRWHGDTHWVNRTCAEETLCGTTHCLAGWLQVCSTNPEIRKMSPELAGILSAPVAAKMFFRKADEVMEWLEKRSYVEEATGAAA